MLNRSDLYTSSSQLRITRKCWFTISVFIIIGALPVFTIPIEASQVKVANEPLGWVLRIDGKPFIVKGVTYNPDKIGEDPNNATLRDWMWVDDNGNGKIDSPYEAYIDSNKNNQKDANELSVGDFKLMQNMGVNTLRVYHHASNDATVQAGYGGEQNTLNQYNHPPNMALLRDLYNRYGIRVAMGDFLGAYIIGSGASCTPGTDYLNNDQKERMKASVRQMVADFKDEPFLLLYIIGNENNYQWTYTNAYLYPVQYAQFVDEIARLIHSLDPNHPVCICNGDLQMIQTLAQYAPNVDIFGTNIFRGPGFQELWQTVKSIYNKPVLITEYGDTYSSVENDVIDENRQSFVHQICWLDIKRNTPGGGGGRATAIGGIAIAWVDVWWQDGTPSIHNLGQNGINNEWLGFFSQGDGTKSPLLRQLRKVYLTYAQSLWKKLILAADAPAHQVDPLGGGQYTIDLPKGQVKVDYPPFVFSSPAKLAVQPASELPNGNLSGNFKPTGLGFNLVADNDAFLEQPIQVHGSFPALAQDGSAQKSYFLAQYDEHDGTWNPLTSTYDPGTNTISAQADHLSLFQVMQANHSSSVTEVRAYPNPLRSARGDNTMFFDQMPPQSRVRIYTLTGELVRDLTANDQGQAPWDGHNQSGESAASGVYFALVQGGSSGSKTIKVAIQR